MVYEQTDVPDEFLRDSSYWMEADKLEAFLLLVAENYDKNSPPVNLLEEVGHNNHELKSWGVLDSVLRMMPRPQEILAQPQRFLSYFISPEPTIENLTRFDNGVSYDLPVSSDQYPLITTYLRAAFEALPLFVGQSMATAQWRGVHFNVEWGHNQNSLFTAEDPGHQISPTLMQSIIDSMEKNQKELEEKNRALLLKNEQLEQIRHNLELNLGSSESLEAPDDDVIKSTVNLLHHHFQRMNDYMVRAQQLITIVVGKDRLSSEVKESMRRVDWEYVKKQFPETVEECKTALQQLRQTRSNHVRNSTDHFPRNS
jgi:hypothetical protein